MKTNDGISLEEEKIDPNSLWNFYKKLITLRRTNSAIQTGRFQFLDDDNDQVLSFLRWDEAQAILVLMNLNDKEESASLDISKFPVALNSPKILELLNPTGGKSLEMNDQKISSRLVGYKIQVWQMR